MKILMIDDDKDFTSLFRKQWLAAFPSDVFFFSNDYPETMDTALRVLPDVILTDVFMPNKNGFQVLKELKSYPCLSHTRFFVLSAFEQDEVISAAGQILADGILPKGLSPAEIRERIL